MLHSKHYKRSFKLYLNIIKVREESEANVRREAEAVEQVKRSVQAAEQARMEKHELEFEIEQLKMQVCQFEISTLLRIFLLHA